MTMSRLECDAASSAIRAIYEHYYRMDRRQTTDSALQINPASSSRKHRTDGKNTKCRLVSGTLGAEKTFLFADGVDNRSVYC
jgi:hypothetical protein